MLDLLRVPTVGPTVGAVLCGGRSTRMGRDKATLVVDGQAMAGRVAAAMRSAGLQRVLAIGGDRPALEAIGLEYVHDLHPGLGPVGGVITALRATDGPVFVSACDMPWLTGEVVAVVIAGLRVGGGAGAVDVQVDVAVARSDRLEPLCAAWQPGAVDRLERFLADGGRSVTRALAQLRATEVRVPAAAVRNANAPGDIG